MTLRETLVRILGRTPEDEWGYGSTFEELEAAPNWSHFGVGRKIFIPSLMTGGIANAFYSLVMISIAYRAGRLLVRWGPWILAGTFAFTAAYVYRIRARWDSTLVHRIAIWWNGAPKILLGDFLLSEDETSLERFQEIHAAAARYATEALPPDIPTVDIVPIPPREEVYIPEVPEKPGEPGEPGEEVW